MLTQGSLTSPSFSLMVIYQLGECSGVAQFSWEWYCCIIQPSLRDHINTCIEEHGKTNKTFNLKSSLRKSNNFFFSLQISDQSLQDFAMLQSHHSRKFNQSPGVLCDLAILSKHRHFLGNLTNIRSLSVFISQNSWQTLCYCKAQPKDMLKRVDNRHDKSLWGCSIQSHSIYVRIEVIEWNVHQMYMFS